MDPIDSMLNEISMKYLGRHILWQKLAEEGNFSLIKKLQRIENKEGGYGTVIVPKRGFSDNDETHNMVLGWLEGQNVNIVNTRIEIARLENSIRPQRLYD